MTLKRVFDFRFRSFRLRSILLIFFASLLSTCSQSSSREIISTSGKQLSKVATKEKVVFWLETRDNDIFDERTLRFVAERGGLVILRASLKGDNSQFDYSSIVKRLHQLKPELSILTYAWSTRYRDSESIEQHTLAGFKDLNSLLLHSNSTNNPKSNPRRFLFGDLSQSQFREWFITRINNSIEKNKVNGIVLDSSFRSAIRIEPWLCNPLTNSFQKFCNDYAIGMDDLFSKLNQVIRPNLLIYNGLWSSLPGISLTDQRKLLEFTDGAAIEYFGLDPDHKIASLKPKAVSFATDILPYLEIMQSHQDKILLVFGRAPWQYTSYQQDYLWQRYLYASYLLGSGPNTYFKYHSSFYIPAAAQGVETTNGEGRSGGLDYYADWDLELGIPLNSYLNQNGLYLRHFSKGTVLVVPEGSFSSKKYTLDSTMFTPEGEALNGELVITPGKGLILLQSPPKLGFNFNEDFEAAWKLDEVRQSSQVISENSNHFLRVTQTLNDQVQKHDLMLEQVRSLNTKDTVQMRFRSNDTTARILLVAEVDDPQKKSNQVVLDVSQNDKCGGYDAKQNYMAFRASPKKLGKLKNQQIPCIKSSIIMDNNGQWKTITVSKKEIDRYLFRRWVFLRLEGNIDIDDVELL